MLVTQEKAAVSLSDKNVLPLSRLLNHGKHKSRGEGGTLEKPRTEKMPTIVKHSRKKKCGNQDTRCPWFAPFTKELIQIRSHENGNQITGY